MPTPTTATHPPVIVLVDRECAGSHDPALGRIAHVACGNRVRLIAPAGPVSGEHWLIDVAAREQDAHQRLASWSSELSTLAIRVDGEVGDENPRLALADARRELGCDAVLLSVAGSTGLPAAPAPSTPLPVRLRRPMGAPALAA